MPRRSQNFVRRRSRRIRSIIIQKRDFLESRKSFEENELQRILHRRRFILSRLQLQGNRLCQGPKNLRFIPREHQQLDRH